VVSFKILLLYLQGKCPQYPLDRALGRFERRFGGGGGGEEKKFLFLSGIEPRLFNS
jgi:hypothetical protein